MTDNEARARELANQICGCANRRQHAADVKLVLAALDDAGRRERIAGLREAAVIAGTMAERPYDSEPEFSAVVAVEAAITARLAALSADTPANRGEG